MRDVQRVTQSDLDLAIQLRERDVEQAKSSHKRERNALLLELQVGLMTTKTMIHSEQDVPFHMFLEDHEPCSVCGCVAACRVERSRS